MLERRTYVGREPARRQRENRGSPRCIGPVSLPGVLLFFYYYCTVAVVGAEERPRPFLFQYFSLPFVPDQGGREGTWSWKRKESSDTETNERERERERGGEGRDWKAEFVKPA